MDILNTELWIELLLHQGGYEDLADTLENQFASFFVGCSELGSNYSYKRTGNHIEMWDTLGLGFDVLADRVGQFETLVAQFRCEPRAEITQY